MGTMLIIAFIALLLALGMAHVIQKSASQHAWFWRVSGFVAVLPALLIYVGMQLSSQMVAWGLLLLMPAAGAWAMGWFLGSAFGKRPSTNGS